jgi:hypothetical protein
MPISRYLGISVFVARQGAAGEITRVFGLSRGLAGARFGLAPESGRQS